jgi:HSP20 family molecular chaperone IbpA
MKNIIITRKTENLERNLMDQLFSYPFSIKNTYSGSMMKTDIVEYENEYKLFIDLPSVSKDEIEINLEVLEKISGNDSSNLQPIEIEESAESMLKLRESNSGDYTIDVLREVDYRLREWLLPELEETPESDLSEVEAFFLNTTDEVLDEVCKEVAYRVREDEGIWQEIGESIDYYLTHYISIEGLKEIENKFVHLEPIEIEEGK